MREYVDIIGYLFLYYDLTYWPNNVSQQVLVLTLFSIIRLHAFKGSFSQSIKS